MSLNNNLPTPPWWVSPLNSLTNFLFPPLPSGTASNPTAAFGQQGAAYGVAPMRAINVSPPASGTAGVGIPGTTMSTGVRPPMTANAPVPQTPVNNFAGMTYDLNTGAVVSSLGLGGEGGTTRTQGARTTAQVVPPTPVVPPVVTPDAQSDYYARQSNVSTTTGTDNYGNEQPLIVPANQVATSGANADDMAAMGYVYNPDQMNWVLQPKGNEYWRTSGANFGKTGYSGKVHGQSFMSEKAYMTWLNRQKKSGKKEEEEALKKATATVTSTFGTG